MANGRCRLHGGKSLGGVASPTFKTGRYSKVLPVRMAENYQAALKDEEILALRDEIALLDARLADVLGNVSTGESSEVWKALRTANADLQAAIRVKDQDKTTQAVRRMAELIATGSTDVEAWNDVYSLIDQRRRVVESERKRLVELQQVITSAQALTMMSVILSIIQTHVTERSVLAAISADFRKLTMVDSGG